MVRILREQEFLSSRRELLLDLNVYLDEASDLSMRIRRVGVNLASADFMADKGTGVAMSMTNARAYYSIKLMSLAYSAGIPIDELRNAYPNMLCFFEEFAHRAKVFDESSEYEGSWVAHLALQGDDFSVVNRLVCLGILLGLGHKLKRVAAIVDYRNPKMDGMIERLLQPFVPGRPFPPDECTRHLPYFKTLKIFKADTAKRPEMMARYLDEWYVASRREPYYNSHTRDASFYGYWCWEAAAITFLLDIDDGGYANAMFYPKDLVDFARQARQDYLPPNFPAPTETELRVKAGDRCPRAGAWESLTIPPQTKVYAEGSIIDEVVSPYGIALWKLST